MRPTIRLATIEKEKIPRESDISHRLYKIRVEYSAYITFDLHKTITQLPKETAATGRERDAASTH